MKPFFKTLVISLFSLFLVFQIAFAEETAPAETTVGINQLMNNADQYPDSIIVQGIVSKVFPQDNLIGLIDNPMITKKDMTTGTEACPMASSKECPMKAAKDCTKTCPMASLQNIGPGAGKKCPMMAGDKASDKSCDKASSKECPMKAAKDCTKTCPMAAAQNSDLEAAKKCPMMASANNCPKIAGATCCDSGLILTLPVQWTGDMPEPSTAVRVAGKIIRKDGRLLFLAESVQVMSN